MMDVFDVHLAFFPPKSDCTTYQKKKANQMDADGAWKVIDVGLISID